LRLAKQRQRRLNECRGEIAMMIGATGRAAGDFGHEINLHIDVDSDNSIEI
jgi:hypothetical protein